MFTQRLPGWPPQPPDVRWGAREAVLCFVGAQILSIVWRGVVDSAPIALEADREMLLLVLGIVGLWLGYFFGSGLISRRFGRGPSVDFDIGISAREAAICVAGGIALQTIVLPLLYWPIGLVTDADPGRQAKLLVDMIDNPADVALLAFAVVLAAPVAEERFFRGLLLPATVASLGLPVGIVGTSLLFALVHQDPIVFPGLALLAMILAWMTATTGRVGPATVTHMAFNATTVVQLLLLS